MTVRVWSVAELTRRIRELLELEVDRVWVQGEISGYKVQRPSGHAYFALKDERALLNCVLWAPNVRRLGWEPRDGARVRAFGGLTVYEPRGSYQLKVEQLLEEGEGNLQARFLALKRKLEAEGLFAPERKRPLPLRPSRIGLVTSASGAVVRDFLRVLRQRWPLTEVVLRPSAVQGTGAAEEIARAIAELDALGGCDVLVLARGGGSLEDLWAFNEEIVARAVVASRTPVVSAIGHETDFTISDFVADVRAATPSHAAEILVPAQEDVRAQLDRDARSLRLSIERGISACALRLARVRQSRGFVRPEDLLIRRGQDLDRLADRLRERLLRRTDEARRRLRGFEGRLVRRSPLVRWTEASARVGTARSALARAGSDLLTRRGAPLDVLRARLRALSPESVLARGYAIVLDAETRRIVRDAAEVAPAALLDIELGRGRLAARVEPRGAER